MIHSCQHVYFLILVYFLNNVFYSALTCFVYIDILVVFPLFLFGLIFLLQINASAPDEPYQVTVTLSDDLYVLDSCPPLPDLEQIQQTLNRTDNFTGFLVHVRHLFKQMS